MRRRAEGVRSGWELFGDFGGFGGNAIRHYHGRAALLERIEADLVIVEKGPWARHIWFKDPRFKEYLPKGDGTVYDIATTGSLGVQQLLWRNLAALRGTVEVQAALSLPDAVAGYVAAITGRHGHRLEVTLAYTGPDQCNRSCSPSRRDTKRHLPEQKPTSPQPGTRAATGWGVAASGGGCSEGRVAGGVHGEGSGGDEGVLRGRCRFASVTLSPEARSHGSSIDSDVGRLRDAESGFGRM